MKKLVLTFLTILCCTALANAQEFTVGDINYNITGTNPNTVEVIVNNYSGNINIPPTVTYENTEYKVTSIGDFAFLGSNSLHSITIPEGLESIGLHAFAECGELASITIPEGLKSIGERAFARCYNLHSITIPSTVTSIGNNAFENCEFSINNFINKSSLYDIDNWGAKIKKSTDSEILYTSSNCYPVILYSDDFGVDVTITSNEYYGFYGVIKFSNTVTSIGGGAFKSSSLTAIDIPSSVTSIKDQAFTYCDSLTSVIISEGLTSIGDHAFEKCSSLTAITIPSSVTSIGDYAFANCSNLSEIYFQGDTPPNIGSNAFSGISSDVVFSVPNEKAVEEYKKAGLSNVFILSGYRNHLIETIKTNTTGLNLTAEETSAIQACITKINNATTFADAKATKAEAMNIIFAAKKRIAIADIEEKMGNYAGNEYLQSLIQTKLNNIQNATNEATITSNRDAAIAIVEPMVAIYSGIFEEGKAAGIEEGKASAFGSLGTPQNGPAVIVTDQDDKQIILYSPKKVQYVKVNDK